VSGRPNQPDPLPRPVTGRRAVSRGPLGCLRSEHKHKSEWKRLHRAVGCERAPESAGSACSAGHRPACGLPRSACARSPGLIRSGSHGGGSDCALPGPRGAQR
jgi:hypothetical protein